MNRPGCSRPVTSAQVAVHRDLEAVVRRHLVHPFRKPLLEYNHNALVAALRAWSDWRGGQVNPACDPLILDAGCGVGWSTLRLAAAFPDHFVMGVDQSLDRLARGKPLAIPENACFVRADLVDFWRLLQRNGIRLARHYLLYPNPWPKAAHLTRRWHGHPVFPDILALGGRIECRSNWPVYIEEFATAARLAGETAVESCAWHPEGEPWTPFEAKYLASGQSLWRVVVRP